MRKRPITLFACALIFLFFPLEYLWRWNRGELLHFGDFLFSIILPFFLLYGLLHVVRLGWYTLIAFGALWGFKDIYQLYTSQGQNIIPLVMHVLVYAISLSYFINPRIRTLYFDPRLRWWRSKKRNETHSPVIIKHESVWHYPLMKNISIGGCFVESSDSFGIDDKIDLAIPLPVPLNVHVIYAKAEVRWISPNPMKRGMGLQFIEIQREDAKALRQFISHQL